MRNATLASISWGVRKGNILTMSQELIRDYEEISILICLSSRALSHDEIKLGREKVSHEGKQSTQEVGLQDRQRWLAGYWQIRTTKSERRDMRRIVEKHSYPRGVGMLETETPSLQTDAQNVCKGPTQPHIELVTVTWTGTRPPSSCGRKPKVAGQSGMLLPENSEQSATYVAMYGWLIRAAINCNEGRATVVVGDGNTDHMAKGCRLGWFLLLLTEKRRKARGIL
jgi:hypothetical protein